MSENTNIPFGRQLAGLAQSLIFGNAGLALATYWFAPARMMDAMVVYTALVLFVMAFGGLFWIAAAVNIMSQAIGSFSGGLVGAFVAEYRAGRAPKMAPVPPTEEVVETNELVSRFRLNNVLTEMLARQYAGHSISRATMVGLNITNQSYWNLANAILQAVGLRNGQTWLGRSESEDLQYLASHYRVSQGQQVFVLPNGGTVWEALDLREVHFLKEALE